jgi:predicted phage terminase large subunit-like protein
MSTDDGLQDMRELLLYDFVLYFKFFFKALTGRELIIPNPPGREPHIYTIGHDLERVLTNLSERVMYNLPPGYGKSTIICFFISWCWAKWPQGMIMYLSYSKPIAIKNTEFIRRITELPEYRLLFGVYISQEMRGKERFRNNFGGEVYGAGLNGTITGFDAGLPGLEEFTGLLVIDDAHKVDEVHSDTIRESIISNYQQTVSTRVRGINVPVLYIGHMLHELDLPSRLMQGLDGHDWRRIALPALDVANNPLYPEKDTKETLLKMKEVNEYTFWSQYQQQPVTPGGSLFKRDHFILLDEEPKMLATFLTCDTAETDKTYNDATVFSFWGLYKIDETGSYGLHWIDCKEIRVEPYFLETEFLSFWHKCQQYDTPPRFTAIERKSTGVTLLSILNRMRGIEVRPIERNVSSGNKTSRFISMQYYVGSKLISLPSYGEHTAATIEHMCKITANETHAFDDRADTLYDAVKIALIDKTLTYENKDSHDKAADLISRTLSQQLQATRKAYYGHTR